MRELVPKPLNQNKLLKLKMSFFKPSLWLPKCFAVLPFVNRKNLIGQFEIKIILNLPGRKEIQF